MKIGRNGNGNGDGYFGSPAGIGTASLKWTLNRSESNEFEIGVIKLAYEFLVGLDLELKVF